MSIAWKTEEYLASQTRQIDLYLEVMIKEESNSNAYSQINPLLI